MLMVARTYSGNPTIADSLLLPSIAAVVVGGTAITGGYGSLERTLVGALTIAVLRVGIAVVGLDPAYEPIAYGVLVAGGVALTIDRSKTGNRRVGHHDATGCSQLPRPGPVQRPGCSGEGRSTAVSPLTAGA